jgi:lipopolysaccharide export system permease protein
MALATAMVTVVLAAIVFLTQSLRFLELVINSGASSLAFWSLTFLSLPRFFEIILPMALLAALIFVYHRMTMDGELVAMRAAGFSPRNLARPAFKLAVIVLVTMYAVTLWIAPKALQTLQIMQESIRAQISQSLFREGVFNSFGDGMSIYVRSRESGKSDGALLGLMIHDARKKNAPPVTITARRGTIQSLADRHEIIVYDGVRQERSAQTGILRNLKFERYTLEIPFQSAVSSRWAEPEERSFQDLLFPNTQETRDLEARRDFEIEIHRRLAGPLMVIVFAVIACAAMLPGAMERRGMSRRIACAIAAAVVIQASYLSAFSLARNYDIGFVMLYSVMIIPALVSYYILTHADEGRLRGIFYPRQEVIS